LQKYLLDMVIICYLLEEMNKNWWV
jgi:hypothetical protein